MYMLYLDDLVKEKRKSVRVKGVVYPKYGTIRKNAVATYFLLRYLYNKV